MFTMMINSFLGKGGIFLLNFYIKHQLLINIFVLAYGFFFLIKKKVNPNVKTDYERLKEKLYGKNGNYNKK